MTSITEWSHSILSAAQDAAAEVRRVSIDALDAGDHDAAAANLPVWEKARSYAARAAEVFSQAVVREIGRLDGFAHMTELEKLWVTHDPEYPQYRQAFDDLRAKSLKRKAKFYSLERLPMWLPHADTPFFIHSHDTWREAYDAFRTNSECLFIARAGHVLACKK